MNEVKRYFQIETGTTNKSANISKIQGKKNFCHEPKAN